MNRVNCPCCGFPTLEARNEDEICRLCSWQDDGQEDPRADEVWGGPNEDYSLTEARVNFKKHLTMRRENTDTRTVHRNREETTKPLLMAAYQKLETCPPAARKSVWQEIRSLEAVLKEIVSERVLWFNENLVKNRPLIDLLHSTEAEQVIQSLNLLAREADDAEFVQHLLFSYSKHPNEQIRGAAIRSFGHLARIQGPVNRELVLSAIEKALADESPSVRAQAQSALADLQIF
jgi:hypothetical protein